MVINNKSCLQRRQYVFNILESFRSDKYKLFLMGYLIYIPDDLLKMMYYQLRDYRAYFDDEKFEKIIKYMDNKLKEGK